MDDCLKRICFIKGKIILIAGFLSVALFSEAQTKNQEYYFHTSSQVCHLWWASNYDYVIKLYPDSTVKFIFYCSENSTGQNSIVRKEYSGRYQFNRDTACIEYLSRKQSWKGEDPIPPLSFVNEVPSFGTVIDAKKPFVAKQLDAPEGISLNIYSDWFNPPTKFIFTDKTAMPLNSAIPFMITSTALQMEALENRFSNWHTGGFKTEF